MNTQNLAHNLEEKIRTRDVILEENVDFDSLLLSDNVLKGLTATGYKKPSPIQLKSIPLGQCGFDLIIKSKSGTGKTLVFAILALEHVNTTKNEIQTLILVPAREIATQIVDVISNIGRFIEGLKVESFIGGLPLEDDIKKLKICHIAVGTPGRVKQLINKDLLKTTPCILFVLDEADKLMDSSFQIDVNEIINKLTPKKQIVTSSATYTKELEQFLCQYITTSPTCVTAENETPVLLGLKQFISVTTVSNPIISQQVKIKNEQLINILSNVSFTQCLIFSNFQSRAESLCNNLNQKGWDSKFISAAQTQLKRLEVVNDLKQFKCRILVSTDLIARGIDVSNVDLVVNYDSPRDAATYLHRMGRAGRFGATGICVTLTIDETELKLMQNIIGVIGGERFSVAKLPEELNGIDLWSLDLKELPQICGIVAENSERVQIDIKNEMFSLKEVEDEPKKEKKFKKGNETQIAENSTENNSFDNSMDAQSFFEALASGSIYNEPSSKRIKEMDDKTDNELKETQDNKIIKKTNNTSSNLETEQRNFDIETLTFCKNKALLNVTKLISDPFQETQDDMITSIDNYKSCIENGEKLTVVKFLETHPVDDVQQILTNSQEFNTFTEQLSVLEQNSSSADTKSDVLENILQTAYDYAIKPDKKHWLSYFSQEDIAEFEKYCLVTSASNETKREDKGDYPEDCENEEQDEEAGAYQEDDELDTEDVEMGHEIGADAAMKWVPVVSSDESQNVSCDEHFKSCFDECSNSLWQNGLSFENVDAFNNWFCQWQTDLIAVRNYVQQNIYVNEMSEYQEKKKHY